MNKLSREIIRILAESSNGLHLTTLLSRLRIAPGQLLLELASLQAQELIERRNGQFAASRSGLARIYLDVEGAQNRHVPADWRSVPKHFIAEKIGPNSPYIPSVRRIRGLH